MSDAGDAAKTRNRGAFRQPDRHSGLAVVLPHILHSFRREPALALTVAYLLVALAGIYFDYTYYQKGFGIPILSLAQIGDYLVAGLQQPMAIALMLLTFPLCWLMDRVNARSRRRQANRRDALRALPNPDAWQKLRLRWLDWHLDQMWGLYIAYVLVIFIYGWVFVGAYARHRVAEVKRGDAAKAVVRMNGDSVDLPSGSGGAWTYLGAVSSYVFVYDEASQRATILPVNAIARLQPLPAGVRPPDDAQPLAPKP